MAELALNDIIQQYDKTVILHKGAVCKVKQVGAVMKLLDLMTQKTKEVEFSLITFQPPLLRLGYVNVDEAAVYVKRLPMRLYKVGISSENCNIKATETHCPNRLRDVEAKVAQMECREFALMMLNHYPSLKEAYLQSKKFGGCVAFDKQFAIDQTGNLFFKTIKVGVCYEPSSAKAIESIEWKKGLDYLALMIGDAYEKATRTFGQKAA